MLNFSSSVRSVHAFNRRNRDENVNRPRISSSSSRSNMALSSSSFSNARSGSTVDSRSRGTSSLIFSKEVALGSGSMGAVWISLLYVMTRSYKCPTVSWVLAAQERRHRTLCGSSNNSCWTSIKSGVNLGVMGLHHGVRDRYLKLLEHTRTDRLQFQSQTAQASRRDSPYQNPRCLCGSPFQKHGVKSAQVDQGDQVMVFRGPMMRASNQGYGG